MSETQSVGVANADKLSGDLAASTFLQELSEAMSWASILETVIGVLLAFLLGLVAYQFQQKREQIAKDAKARSDAIDALNRTTQAINLNLAMLTALKSQFLVRVVKEAKEIRELRDSYFDSSEPNEKIEIMRKLAATAERMKALFQSTIPRPVTPFPDYKELFPIAKEMPQLANFLFNAIDSANHVNEHIRARNTLLFDMARETADAIGGRRLIYFCSQIPSLSTGAYDMTDTSLMYLSLAHTQIDYFAKANPGEGILKLSLKDEVSEAIPKTDRYKELMDSLATFGVD